MRKIDNWEEIKSTTDEVISFESIPVGPQICKIIDIEDVEEKEYLKLWFDVADGDFKNVFKDQEERFGNWPNQGVMYWSYKASAERFFASKITAIEKSNDGYKYELFAEYELKGKYFVGNFGEEEYLDKDNQLKTSIKCQEVRSLQALKEGKIKELKKKELKLEQKEQVQEKLNAIDEDLPF